MQPIEPLPPIDERLALPDAGYEILDGVVTFVAPADPPHAERHHAISMLIGAHVHPRFKVAIDMLTRTSQFDDLAPDVSVFPRDPDPATGRRGLEQLAFEIVSTESMSHASRKAAKLADRGVRRVFAIDLVRARVTEWSRGLATWQVLELHGRIEDPALAVPVSVAALLEAANVEDEVARALVAKANPVIQAAGSKRYAQAILDVLAARGLDVDDVQHARILDERDPACLDAWLRRAVMCASTDELT